MLKRTIVVLAVLSMVVALIPAVAFAATTSVAVTVTGQDIDGAATLTIGKAVISGADAVVGPYASGKQTVTFALAAGKDYNGDGTAAGGETPANPTSGAITAVVGTTTYYGTIGIDDIDGDGTAGESGAEAITWALPAAASASLSGVIAEDAFGDKGVAATDNVYDAGDAELGGAMVSVYRGGVLHASKASTGGTGAWSIIVGPGAMTVMVDVEGAAGGTWAAGYDDDACDADHPAADCVATPGDIDEGEIQWFAAKASAAAATVITVGADSLTGVNVIYDNDTTGVNATTWDHIDVLVGSFTDTAGHWADSAIAKLKAVPVVTGCTTTTFCPEADITRAEFAVMLQRAMVGPWPLSCRLRSVMSRRPTGQRLTSRRSRLLVWSWAVAGPSAPRPKIGRAEAVEMIARAALGGADATPGAWVAAPAGTAGTGTLLRQRLSGPRTFLRRRWRSLMSRPPIGLHGRSHGW